MAAQKYKQNQQLPTHSNENELIFFLAQITLFSWVEVRVKVVKRI